VFFLFIVYSFEVFVPSNIPFLNFLSFPFHLIVYLPPLCYNFWPSSQYCFLFLPSLIHFFILFWPCITAHFFSWISVLCPYIPLLSTVCPCLFVFVHSFKRHFLHTVHLCYPSNGAPGGGGCGAAAPTPKPPKPKFKRNVVNIVMSDVCDLPFSCNDPLKSADD
jgi:hypothetical protein